MDDPRTPERDYTTLPSIWRLYETSRRRLEFAAVTVDEWRVWREQLTHQLVELLGGLPVEAPPLSAVILESSESPDFTVEKVAFQSDWGSWVPCYVLIPHFVQPPYRPVIALHGHGSGGAAHLLGRTIDEATATEEAAFIRSLNYDYARQLAEHGFMVFVPEIRGFGERMDARPDMIHMIYNDPLWKCSCRAENLQAMLLGKTLNGLRVWDIMRTIDYIASRPEAKISGIGCVGLSGGGMMTMYAAALDPRISVAVISGYFNTFRASIMSVWHCECNYVPGILQYAEMSDITALIAPHPLLIESGTEDGLFPSTVTETEFEKVRAVYALLGHPERVAKDIYPGGHRFSGRKAFDWLKRWMSA